MKTQNIKLKVLKASDNVSIQFGEWFDKVNGNTYYDATLNINNETHHIKYCYGYNAGDKQSIDEALAVCGYRVRVNKYNVHASYKNIDIYKCDKLKRELNKQNNNLQ